MKGKILSRLFRMETISGFGRCPVYLYRWTLLRIGKSGVGVYLHKFVGDDWCLDLHDHPKRFISIGLWGGYREHTPLEELPGYGDPNDPLTAYEEFRAPWVRTFPAEWRHRISGPTSERPCWTLAIVGPAVREWGFWGRAGWVPWRDYVHPDNEEATKRKACP